MSDLWRTPVSRNAKDVSRDFIHLSQARCTVERDGDCRYEIAVILENCIEDEDYDEKYKDTAVANLVAMARNDKKIKGYLEYFASDEDPDCKNIKPIAEEILEKSLQRKLKVSDRETSSSHVNSKTGCSII